MQTMIEDVAQFLTACGHTDISESQSNLYGNLVLEEFRELMESTGGTVEELDAVLDLIWVLIGFGLSRGYKMEDGWKEVVRSNLAKISDDGFVHRREDGKILKPKGWTPPNLMEYV